MEIAIPKMKKSSIRKLWVGLAVAALLLAPALVQQFILAKKTQANRVPSGTSLVAAQATVALGATNVVSAVTVKIEGCRKLTFDTLKSWTYVEGKTPIPQFIKDLDNKHVEMVGFMMPLTQVENITEFLLVPSLWGCCYGQPPAVNHIVLIQMPKGRTSKFYNDVIRVRGRFHVGETREDGELVSLYTLTPDEITAR
jgi:hypothetical protein